MSEQSAQPRQRVLVVEDEAMLQDLAKAFLVEAGFDCDVFSNAADAVGALSSGRKYDAYLLDGQFPLTPKDKAATTDGSMNVLRHIYTTPELAQMPGVILTGRVDLVQDALKPMIEQGGMAGNFFPPPIFQKPGYAQPIVAIAEQLRRVATLEADTPSRPNNIPGTLGPTSTNG